MKQVRINRLTLSNFKGVKAFSFDANGSDIQIYGDNATGKTTLFDSFLWLLFDKDSQNKKDFSIKTLENGKAKPMLDHEVECELLVDGQAITLRKVYREKWTKTRGSAAKEFSGHETDYFIDGTPLKKAEYSKRIESIMPEELFKLLTSPSYFNEQVKWQDRRKILLRVCGEVSNDEIFKSNNELKGLELILKGKSMEDFQKTVNARRKAINDELDRLPIRIDEITKSIPAGDGNLPELKAEVAKVDTEIEELQAQVSAIKNGNAILMKEGELQKVEMDITNFRRDFESDSKEKVYQLRAKLQEEQSNQQTFVSRKKEKERNIAYNNENINRIEQNLAALRSKWKEVNAKLPAHNTECACPTCGQELPEEQVKAAEEKALAAFNLQKSNELQKIKDEGNRGASDKKLFEDENQRFLAEIEEINGPIASKEKAIAKLTEELKAVEGNVQDVSESQNYQKLLNRKEDIQIAISELKERAEDAAGDIGDEIEELKAKRSALNAEIAVYANVGNLQARIQDLKDQEELLAAEFEKLEHHLFLTEEFIRAKVKIMEEKINAKFKFARFKLFEEQINGGLQEVCETLYDGVPYGSGLNNAAKINVGLDIINTLSAFHGIEAPIFIDNAEAVTKLIETDAQLISLIVSEPDKVLRIETPKLEEAV
ncbi:AAA family ATPase [Planococcus sp. YIM B11945]|uniref:AAA family ATPase n=1 Tax=Planococcus sp. YIM B11945 TaxID=3435410 RepID=UPI003D7E38BE